MTGPDDDELSDHCDICDHCGRGVGCDKVAGELFCPWCREEFGEDDDEELDDEDEGDDAPDADSDDPDDDDDDEGDDDGELF